MRIERMERSLFKEEINNQIDFNEKARKVLLKVPLYYSKSKLWYLWNKEKFRWEIVDETDILNSIDKEFKIANISFGFFKNAMINALMMEARKNEPEELKVTQVQFKDEIVDITNGSKIKATPEYFSFNPIPYSLGDTECTPNMDRFIESWVGKKYLKTMYQWIAYHLLPSYPIARVMCFNGAGSNGKSTCIELIEKFLGNENIASGDFRTIFLERFGTSKLYKKLGLFLPETNHATIENTAIFKSVTGNDTINVEFKRKNGFDYKNYAKVTMLTNTVPISTDKTDGFYRRWIIIDFPNKFKDKFNVLEQIPKQEYKNLARKCIRLLKELLENGEFNNEGTIEERREIYERKSNPVSSFIKEKVVNDPEGFILRRHFAQELRKWCIEKGYRILTNKEITKVMCESYDSSSRTFNGERDRAWLGIQWKTVYKAMNPRISEEVIG
jgi:P4 family phage/plasmid primase-like protien